MTTNPSREQSSPRSPRRLSAHIVDRQCRHACLPEGRHPPARLFPMANSSRVFHTTKAVKSVTAFGFSSRSTQERPTSSDVFGVAGAPNTPLPESPTPQPDDGGAAEYCVCHSAFSTK
ncbi:hypothetical protein MRX96_011897 [Rhipicephalus microplus]